MTQKLFRMNVNVSTISWILDYLTNRPQFVKTDKKMISDTVLTNTGAPQGTVLAPFLFSLYTADFRSSHSDCPLTKFADDTGLTGLISNDDDTMYKQEINRFVEWCDCNFLELNVGKTKEMVFDNRKKITDHDDVVIKGQVVEKVDTYKYLGIVFDSKLTWKTNVEGILKKANSRMYFLRKLKSFNVCNDILQMFYTSTVSSVLFYGAVCWGGNINKRDKDRIEKFIKKASGVVGRKQDSFSSVHERRLTDKLQSVLTDDMHPLRQEFDSRLMERSGRYRVPNARTTRYKNSFVPAAITATNEHFTR